VTSVRRPTTVGALRRGIIGFLVIVAIGAALAVTTCRSQDGNFSQFPGFDAYFKANPPSDALPTQEERALLWRNRPHLFIAEGEDGPIDFYRDYIGEGELRDGDGALISASVTQDILNRHKADPDLTFVHKPSGTVSPRPVLYGRVDHDTVTFDSVHGPLTQTFTFLTYNAVFRTSGLPAALPKWQGLLLGLFVDLEDWHQLDHYTAATVVLDGVDAPVAVVLQQHNQQHSYLVGRDIMLGPDGRIAVDAAIRSNEFYPHASDRQRHRAVAMPDGEGMRYLIAGQDQPWMSADDVTEGTVPVDYDLSFLAPSDAFYTFQGFLGEKRLLPGRDGPPGAAYNTLPSLKARAMQLFVGYWRSDDPEDMKRYETAADGGGGLFAFAEAQKRRFFCDWRALRGASEPC